MTALLLTHTGVYNEYDLSNIDLERVAAAKLFHMGYPTLLPRLYADGGAALLALLQRGQGGWRDHFD